jgi:TetR/AcrR family transcriptional regulator
MENQDKKRELIIEAAIKRFAHFGLAKTTMTEIAADLSLSKALLYYYFPDKISLYAAVLENIIQEMDVNIKKSISKLKDSKEALLSYLDTRHKYILKYYNILDYIRVSGPDLPESVAGILQKARGAELQLIASIIQLGIDTKEIHAENAHDAASLLMDALTGMRFASLQNKQAFQLQKLQLEDLLKRQKQLTEIFIKGLK